MWVLKYPVFNFVEAFSFNIHYSSWQLKRLFMQHKRYYENWNKKKGYGALGGEMFVAKCPETRTKCCYLLICLGCFCKTLLWRLQRVCWTFSVCVWLISSKFSCLWKNGLRWYEFWYFFCMQPRFFLTKRSTAAHASSLGSWLLILTLNISSDICIKNLN